MKPQYICIEGNIGAGKTTLASLLAEDLNARLILEQFEENAFLPMFYAEPERYAFAVEMAFLADRYHQLKEKLSVGDLFQPLIIADYTINKSLIFARQNLRDIEYKLYRDFFNIAFRQLPKPDVIVYLQRPLNSLKNNIAKRGREYEAKISDLYLRELDAGYNNFIENTEGVKVLKFNADEYDFLNKSDDLMKIKKQIFELFI